MTFDKRERWQLIRRHDNYRKHRQSVRPSRSTGKKPWLAERNREREYKYLLPPTGTARTTRQIADSLVYKEKETNHAVRISFPLDLPVVGLPIHPYVLGVWLGDGNSRDGGITCFDDQILEEIKKCNYSISPNTRGGRYRIVGLYAQLKSLNLLTNKHIPSVYLRASKDQRLALLQGLMDTDGYTKGKCEFTNTNKILIDGVLELILTLGIKAVASEGVATLKKRVIGPKWRITFRSSLDIFRLERKLAAQKRTGFNLTTGFRYITSVRPVKTVPVKCIAVDDPSHCYLAGKTFIPTHNSRAVICQLALDDCQRVPNLKGLFLRKLGKAAKESFEDLRRQSLMQVPHNYRTHLGVLEFPNGSRIVLGHFKNENDIDAYLGLEYDVIAIEEDTQLSAGKKRDIKTCLRTSKQNWRPRTYRTTNPGGIDHQGFKKLFIEPWRKDIETSTRFIPATVHDNRFVNVEYKATLESLTGWQRKAWLDGEWDIAAGQYFSTWRYEKHVIEPFEIPQHWSMWASLDYGFTHNTAAYLFTEFDGCIYVIAEHCERKKLPPYHAAHIHGMGDRFKRKVDWFEAFFAGHDCFAHHGDAGGRTIAQQYAEQGITLTPANIDRIAGWARVLDLLGDPDNDQEPRIKIFSNCVRLIDCMPMLQHNPNKPEDVLKVDVDEDGNGGDDPADALRYGIATPRYKQAPVTSASMSYFR